MSRPRIRTERRLEEGWTGGGPLFGLGRARLTEGVHNFGMAIDPAQNQLSQT